MLDVLLFLDFLLPGLIRLRRRSVSSKIRESFPDNEFIMCNMCLLVPAALLKTLITVADQIAAAVQSSPGPGNPCSTLFRSLIIVFQLPFFDFASACPNLFAATIARVYHVGVWTTKMMGYTSSAMFLQYTLYLSTVIHT